MSHPIDAIQAIYAAFGRGDIAAILERLAPDVRWEHWDVDHSAQRAGVPWLVPREGRAGAMAFFSSLSALEFLRFEVLDLIEGDRQVVAEIELEFRVRATGEAFHDVELHVWSFDKAGLVDRFRHFVDTVKHMRAAGLGLALQA